MGLLLIPILLLVSGGVNCRKYPKNNVPDSCQFLLEDRQVFRRRCQGTYPEVAYTKYRDKLIKVGEPFSIYLSPARDTVLAVQKRSPLRSCLNLQFENSNTFHCLGANRNETIVVNEASIFCFPFHIQLPDDLMQQCLIQNKIHWRQQKEQLYQVLSTWRSILHYTYDEDVAPRLRMPRLLSLLLLQVLNFIIF